MDTTDDTGAGTGVAHVVLIGLMGSGKSAVGRLVAERLGRPFVDVDDVIVAQTGMTVRELWERGGEVTYRPLERDVAVHTLAGDGPDVLGMPAGALDDELVQRALEAADTWTVWLRAEVPTLVKRVAGSDHRPLLGDDPHGVLTAHASARAATYEAVADLVLDVEGRDPDELAAAITGGRGGG
ncbi:MAG TPA: shikimate kinase [Aquihabitans sp.]|nr:shikimate kinase [Aquihabitans sp.]